MVPDKTVHTVSFSPKESGAILCQLAGMSKPQGYPESLTLFSNHPILSVLTHQYKIRPQPHFLPAPQCNKNV